MAYTTPATFVAGNVLTAAQLNTGLRDNIAWLATDSPSCRVYNSALQTIGNGSLTALTFNSERYDNSAMHSTSSNTSRITIPTGGTGQYVIGGLLEFSGMFPSGAAGLRQIILQQNATTDIGYSSSPSDSVPTTPMSTCATWSLTAADYIEEKVFQNSGGNLDVLVANGRRQEFWAFWIRT